MTDQLDPHDPANSAIKLLKSPLVVTILGVIVLMTPAITGMLPANATLAAVILAGLKVIAYIHGALKAQNTSIQGAADIAITKEQTKISLNPPSFAEPNA